MDSISSASESHGSGLLWACREAIVTAAAARVTFEVGNSSVLGDFWVKRNKTHPSCIPKVCSISREESWGMLHQVITVSLLEIAKMS